jgi:hypothetical protein
MFTPRPDRAYEFASRVQFGQSLEGIVLPQGIAGSGVCRSAKVWESRDESPPKRKGAQEGSKNKKSAAVREAAQVYNQRALLTLVRLIDGRNMPGKNRSEVLLQTQAFAQELLNRAWGRPTTALTGEGGASPQRSR